MKKKNKNRDKSPSKSSSKGTSVQSRLRAGVASAQNFLFKSRKSVDNQKSHSIDDNKNREHSNNEASSPEEKSTTDNKHFLEKSSTSASVSSPESLLDNRDFLIDDEIHDQPDLICKNINENVDSDIFANNNHFKARPKFFNWNTTPFKHHSKENTGYLENGNKSSSYKNSLDCSNAQVKANSHKRNEPRNEQNANINKNDLYIGRSHFYVPLNEEQPSNQDFFVVQNDLHGVKSLLLELRHILHKSETQFLLGYSNINRHIIEPANPPGKKERKNQNCECKETENKDLERQIIFLRDELDAKDRDIKNLINQVSMLKTQKPQKFVENEKRNAATQTGRFDI